MGHTYRALLIPVVGPVEELWLAGDDAAGLRQLQAAVGGYIEAVAIPEFVADWQRGTCYVNDEGKLGQLPINRRATDFLLPGVGLGLRDYIAGPMVVCGFDPASGANRSIPPGVERRVRLIEREAGVVDRRRLSARLGTGLADAVLAQAWQFRQQGPVMPTFFLVDAKGGMTVMGGFYDGPVDKLRMAELVAAEVRRLRPAAVLWLADAWMRGVSENDPEPFRAPSEAVDAVEVLLVQCWTRAGAGRAVLRTYRQHDDGTLEVLEDQVLANTPPEVVGPFALVVEALTEAR